MITALEHYKLLKKNGNQICLCTDPHILDSVYAQCGRPSAPIHTELLHWWPFKIRYYEQDVTHK